MKEADDGRVRRGDRNRERILDALHELVKRGVLHPTAEQVARRARVGERSVYRHFRDMERLHADLGARMEREVGALFTPPARSEAALADRLRLLIGQRRRLFEYLAPFRRSASRFRLRSPFIERGHARMAQVLRAQLEIALPEVADMEADRVEAIDTLTSFETWDRLRQQRKLGPARSARIVEGAVLALLR